MKQKRYIVSDSMEHIDISTPYQYAVVDTIDDTVFCQCKTEHAAMKIAAALNKEADDGKE